jgi:iron complex transport system ATP-binding protein
VSPFTVEQFVLMGRYPYLSPFSPVSKKDREVVYRSMEQTGTSQFADRRLGTLSSGERQKVYIAAALAQGAEILLLDEPTTFLDYRHQAEIRMLLSQINRTSSATVVTVTHDVNHAVLESDRILALREGQVAFCGPPGEIMKQDILQQVYGTAFLLVDHPDVPLPVIVPHAPREGKP